MRWPGESFGDGVFMIQTALNSSASAAAPNRRSAESEAVRLLELVDATMIQHNILLNDGNDESTITETLQEIENSGIDLQEAFREIEELEAQMALHGRAYMGLIARSEPMRALLKRQNSSSERILALAALFPLYAAQLLLIQAILLIKTQPESNKPWFLIVDAAERFGVGRERLAAIAIEKESKSIEGRGGRASQLERNEQAKRHIQSEWRKANEKKPYREGKLDFARTFAMREVKTRFELTIKEKTIASDWLKGL